MYIIWKGIFVGCSCWLADPGKFAKSTLTPVTEAYSTKLWPSIVSILLRNHSEYVIRKKERIPASELLLYKLENICLFLWVLLVVLLSYATWCDYRSGRVYIVYFSEETNIAEHLTQLIVTTSHSKTLPWGGKDGAVEGKFCGHCTVELSIEANDAHQQSIHGWVIPYFRGWLAIRIRLACINQHLSFSLTTSLFDAFGEVLLLLEGTSVYWKCKRKPMSSVSNVSKIRVLDLSCKFHH